MKKEGVGSITIITRIGHGKTTLVGRLLRQSDVFHTNQEVQERVTDSNDLERERGTTILPRNAVASYKGTEINIIDTPGHTDFGGEVERVLKVVGGVVLVVDTHEGLMPQTKLVFQKALDPNLSVIVCINGISRPETGSADIINETLELMMDPDATDEQLDYPFIYTSARNGFAECKIEDPEMGTSPLFEVIIGHIPAPEGDPGAETRVLINTIDYDEFIDRISIGCVDNGGLKMNQGCVLMNHREPNKFKEVGIEKLYEFDGLKRVEMQEVGIGSIVTISGIADIHIGDTICTPNSLESIPFQKIPEPTIVMYFVVSDSPLAGQEGKFITSHHLHDRLFRELNTDVSLWVEGTDSTDCFKVSGRGELHLFILIENMRHKGFEFAISKAEVLYKCDERNCRLEPTELAYVDALEEYTGVIIQELTSHKGVLQGMSQAVSGYSRLKPPIPSRGLIGYRGGFLTDIKGNGILNTIFDGYAEYKDDLFYCQTGSLIAFKASEAITYGLSDAQERGILFIGLSVKAYSGMVVDQSPRAKDTEINARETKKLTNTCSFSADKALRLAPPKIMNLKQALGFINTNKLPEVTPGSLRICEKVLDPTPRKRAPFKNK